MATMTPVPFGQLSALIGNNATPTVFAAPCGITSYGWSNQINTNDEDLPACDDPDAPSWRSPKVVSVGEQLQMQGFADGAVAGDQWHDWAQSGAEKPFKFIDNKRKFSLTGPAICTARDESGARRESLKLNVTVTWTEKPTRAVLP